jgi:hypothetical protein
MAAPTERTARMRGNLTSREQRLTESLIAGLQELAEPERQPPKLSRSEPRGAIPAGRGYAESNYQPGAGAAGIAGPLVEGLAAPSGEPAGSPSLSRTYYAGSQAVSSDGLFVWEFAPINTLQLRDGTGSPVELILANPYA